MTDRLTLIKNAAQKVQRKSFKERLKEKSRAKFYSSLRPRKGYFDEEPVDYVKQSHSDHAEDIMDSLEKEMEKKYIEFTGVKEVYENTVKYDAEWN